MMKSSAPVMSSVRLSGGAVRPHPGEPVGKGSGEELAVEELPRVLAQPIEWGVLEATIERAQEVTAVTPVEGQQRRRLPHKVGHEACPPRRRQVGGWRARHTCRRRWRT